MESTYVDVPLNKVKRFIELHKKVTDLSQGEDRTIQSHWVYRHWFGSGAAILIYDEYNSVKDAIDDNFKSAYKKNMKVFTPMPKKKWMLLSLNGGRFAMDIGTKCGSWTMKQTLFQKKR